jgi:cytochrome P450
VYEKMRAEHGPVVPVELEPGVYGWLVTDYSTLISWSRDTTTFTHDSRIWKDYREGRVSVDSTLIPMMAPRANALFVDGSEHQRLRRALTDGLGSVSERRLSETVRRYADRLVDEFCARGEADALNEYARMLPLLVMNELFGFDHDQGVRFASAMRNLWMGVDAERSNAEAERALSEVVAAKHRAPGDDLTTQLIQHRAGLSDEEVIHQLMLIVAAANEPTADLISSAIRAVLSDPSVMSGAEASLSAAALDDVVNEVLWNDPPITNYPVIYPRVDVPIGGGRVIEAGTPVLLGFAASDHFFLKENAAELAETTNRAHVAWGAGPHRCPAIDEATTMATVATRVLLTRLPGLRLAVRPEELRWQLSSLYWIPVQLPIRFTPQSPLSSPPEEGESWTPSDSPPETSEPRPSTSAAWGLSSLSNFLVRLLRGS